MEKDTEDCLTAGDNVWLNRYAYNDGSTHQNEDMMLLESFGVKACCYFGAWKVGSGMSLTTATNVYCRYWEGTRSLVSRLSAPGSRNMGKFCRYWSLRFREAAIEHSVNSYVMSRKLFSLSALFSFHFLVFSLSCQFRPAFLSLRSNREYLFVSTKFTFDDQNVCTRLSPSPTCIFKSVNARLASNKKRVTALANRILQLRR